MKPDEIQELEGLIDSYYGNTAGIVVQKNGETVYESYRNGFTADRPAHVFSVTKSIFSMLIGIAVDRGSIGSIDQNVLDFFPGYAVKRGKDDTACHPA